MVPDPSPWLRSWISAYPLGSRLFAYSPSPREASGQIIKSSGFERIRKWCFTDRESAVRVARDDDMVAKERFLHRRTVVLEM